MPYEQVAKDLIKAGARWPRGIGAGALSRSVHNFPPDPGNHELLVGIASALGKLGQGVWPIKSMADLIPWIFDASYFDEAFFEDDLLEAGWSREKVLEFIEDGEHIDERYEACYRAYAERLQGLLEPKELEARTPVFYVDRRMGYWWDEISAKRAGEGVSRSIEEWKLGLNDELVLSSTGNWYWLTYRNQVASPDAIVDELVAATEALLGALLALDVVKIESARFHWRSPKGRKMPKPDLPLDRRLPTWLRAALRYCVAVQPPSDLSELQKRYLKPLGLHGPKVVESEIMNIRQLFGTAELAGKVRQGSKFFFRAVTSRSPGELFSNCGIALEALLLEQKDARNERVQLRLQEAVAHHLGPARPEAMKARRAWVRQIYSSRSEWVHQGNEKGGLEHQLKGLALTGVILGNYLKMLE